ncbi:hypothetical protein [uncultured Pseudoteredinibacter sp.]|uniref:hypothetical protein n=1 Tax=uncultured Pseudoteredinibacter sp. TaxID=1641701 RepID=UPI00261A3A6D|nr:hypothetical protein [uncultured Pseudoteredinibacter sp.]
MKRIALLILITFTLGASSSGNIQYTFEASDPNLAVKLAKEFLQTQGFGHVGELNGVSEYEHSQYSVFAYLGSVEKTVYLGFTELRGGCSSVEGVPSIEREYENYQSLLDSRGIKIKNFVASKSANKSINYAPSAPAS